MTGNAPWIVGVVVTVLVAMLGTNGVLVERMRRRSTDADRKLTDTGQALTGFKELVDDIREQRDYWKAAYAEMEADRDYWKRKATARDTKT